MLLLIAINNLRLSTGPLKHHCTIIFFLLIVRVGSLGGSASFPRTHHLLLLLRVVGTHYNDSWTARVNRAIFTHINEKTFRWTAACWRERIQSMGVTLTLLGDGFVALLWIMQGRAASYQLNRFTLLCRRQVIGFLFFFNANKLRHWHRNVPIGR